MSGRHDSSHASSARRFLIVLKPSAFAFGQNVADWPEYSALKHRLPGGDEPGQPVALVEREALLVDGEVEVRLQVG